MSYYGKDGALYETCDECGLTVEVDDRQDAQAWGINHWDAFHNSPPEEQHNIFGNDFPCCDTTNNTPCDVHEIHRCTICI